MYHFLPPVPVKIPPVHKDAGQNGANYLKRGPGNLGLVVAKALGSKNPLIAQLPDAFAFYTEYSVMALGDNGVKRQECMGKALYKAWICCAQAQPK